MRGLSLFFILFLITAAASFAQSFRSAGSGDWHDLGTWQTFNGVTWVPAGSVPTSSNAIVTIQSTHTVTVQSGFPVTIDELVVEGELEIAAGGFLTLVDGAGTDLTAIQSSSLVDVLGTIQLNNGAVIDNLDIASRLRFQSAANYIHNYTSSIGSLPVANWNANSTVTIQGLTNNATITANNSWAQDLGHVVYNNPGQAGTVDFSGNLNSIGGNLSIVSTGNNLLQFSSSQNPTINIGGDFTVSGTSRFVFGQSGNSTVVNIAGDWTYTSSHVSGSYLTFTGNTTVNLTGNFLMNATNNGKIRMTNAGTTGVSTINFMGDFALNSGRIDEVGSEPSQGNLRFLKNGTQLYTKAGTIISHVNYYIGPNTTLDLGTQLITGYPSSFVLDGTIIVGSTDALGAIHSSNARGNIRTPNGSRIYNNGSTIIYRSSSPQFMGVGQPRSANVTTIIDNPMDVRLAANITIDGSLVVEEGTLHLNNFTLTSGGTFNASGGDLGGTALSGLIINGTTGGNWGTLVFDPAANTLGFLTLSRTGLNAGVTLNSVLQIDSMLNLQRGIFTNTAGLTMLNGSGVTRYNTSSLSGSMLSVSGGSYNLTYRTFSSGTAASFSTGAELISGTTGLGDLTVNMALAADDLTLDKAITVNGSVTFSRGSFSNGAFDITATGPFWSDNLGNFSGGTGTVVFTGATSVGGSSVPNFVNVELASTALVTTTSNFVLTGNLEIEPGGVLTMGTTTMTLSGTNVQNISAGGAELSNITVSKTGGSVQLGSVLNLTGVLQFGSTSLNRTFASNGFLVLRSTTDGAGSGTASIHRVQSGNSVTGNVTVERFMSGEGQIYRYISSPVSNAMVSEWMDDFDVTGPFVDPSPRRRVCDVYTNPASPSLFFYNETVGGDINQGYVSYPQAGSASTNSPLQVGRGYVTFIRACNVPTVVDVVGTVNQGNIALPVTYTVNTPTADGWNLVGNPYPSTIDWDLGSWTKTRISSIISITDNGTGMIRYYDPGVTEDIPNGQIAAGQAFFVRATAVNPSLVIRENCKVTTPAEFFRVGYSSKPSFAMVLSNGSLFDRAYVKVQDEALPGLDDLDAPKITNPTFNFATLSDDAMVMAINAVNGLPCGSVIKTNMTGVSPGTYSINLEKKDRYFADLRFTLTDRFLKREFNLSSKGHYTFEVTADPMSSDPQRFYVTLTAADGPKINVSRKITAEGNIELTASLEGNDADIFWFNEANGGEPISQGATFTYPANDHKEYFVSAGNSNGICSQRSRVTGAEDSEAGVRVFPNPIQKDLVLEVFDPTVLQMEVVNLMGQQLAIIEVAGQTRQFTVDFSERPKGVYLLTVKKKSGKINIRLLKD